MIESLQFRNYKALRATALPLGRFTLIVGPNGSGKSTAIQALPKLASPSSFKFESIVTASREAIPFVEVIVTWRAPHEGAVVTVWSPTESARQEYRWPGGKKPSDRVIARLQRTLAAARIYSLDASAIALPITLQPQMELAHNGSNLAGVLDRLRDRDPERFEALNAELSRWLPEFDRVLFRTPDTGQRALLLRTRHEHHAIPAQDASQGTLFALAILTLAYLSEPPPILCFEEPDRGLHPRLLRDVRDALYRLSYPEKVGEGRAPVQVIATTHSPYFLDLYKDHPEEVVIAHKTGSEARFERLADRSDLMDILGQATLGEVWYSGILGGVPSEE